MKKKEPFHYNMTRNQRILGRCYFPIHVFVLPILIAIYTDTVNGNANMAKLNLIYYVIGFFIVLAFMRTYLRRDFDMLCDHFIHCIVTLCIAYLIDLILSLGISLLGEYVLPSQTIPNNDAVVDLAGTEYGTVFAMSVFLAPIVEEVLFRGVIFGAIRQKYRITAYIVSVLLFSIYHVWQYAIAYSDPAYLLTMIYYVPVSIALAWCYDSTQSIWTPIFFHMIINAISMKVLVS